MNTASIHHQVLVIGGGNAGISVAARLRRKGLDDVAIVEPSSQHYYQPLWTLVGGGCAPASESVRRQSSVMPKGVAWIKDAVRDIDPDNRLVTTDTDATITYDYLVVCPGIQLDWGRVPGMADAVASPSASSNYTFELAPKTWERIRDMRSGSALFTMPSGPIKCAGAPQKIAYLAADYWRQQGVLDDIDVTLVLPTPGMFGVKVFSDELARVAENYGIKVHLSSEVVEIDAVDRNATVVDNVNDTKESVPYDFLHVVPPQSAPDWLKATPLADPDHPFGYVEVDKHTMRHTRYPEVFSLGDAGSTPNSKTGAAVREQAPVLVQNLLAQMGARPVTQKYGGYAACPLTTARDKMLLAEFDYTMEPKPTFPIIDTTRERKDMWYLKRYGLSYLYWHAILTGRA